MYNLGQNYGGDAIRPLRRFCNKGGRGRQCRRSNGGQRRPQPKWMQGIKFFFKCGKEHRANDHHTRGEVTEAIQCLKARHPTASLVESELDYISAMISDEGHAQDDDERDDEANNLAEE